MTEQTLDPAAPAPSTEIFRLMGEILAALPAIGKNQRNQEQGFMFRGYDDVLNALNPLMSDKGVFVVPDVINRLSATRATRSGGVMYEVNLHVRFTFYAPDGSWVAGSGWGEGTDMGDKATNKAMTNAFKYVLFQTFAISTQEASETDSDRFTPEASAPDVLYCRVCTEPIEGARSDKELMRAHLIEEHAWVRVNVGTPDEGVITPEKAAQLEAAKQDADAEGTTAAAPSTVGTTPVDDGNVEAADDFDWVDALKGQELIDTAKEHGVSASGKVGDIRERIKAAVRAGADTAADDTPAADEAAPAATEPAAGSDDTGTAEGDGSGDGGGFQCPDCDDPPFPTEEAYTDHWYAMHDEGNAEDADAAVGEPENDGTTDDTEALVVKVKDAIANLKGDHARAYGKYRRDKKLPRPDEMDAEQARALLEFLGALASS